MSDAFQIKTDPELWASLDMDVDRFMNIPPMLTQSFTHTFLRQKNRPANMAYFDDMVSGMFTKRIREMTAVRQEGKPVIGTFCVYVPEDQRTLRRTRIPHPKRRQDCPQGHAPGHDLGHPHGAAQLETA